MRDTTLLFWVLLLVQGVVGDTDGVKPVSVMEGDSVTLNPDPTDLEGDEEIIWKFGNEIIAKMKETFYGIIYTKDWIFKDRLDMDKQTGSLTITNIRTEHIGHYSVDIRTSTGAKLKTFQVTVHGEMKTVSVMEGEPIILYTGLIEIQGHDLILWKFEDHLIAEINKETNQFLSHDTRAGGRFKGRLQLSETSGSLTIRGSRITDSEDYSLHMISSSQTIQRTISVTVSGAVSGMSGASVVLMVWAVTVFLLQEV